MTRELSLLLLVCEAKFFLEFLVFTGQSRIFLLQLLDSVVLLLNSLTNLFERRIDHVGPESAVAAVVFEELDEESGRG